MPTVAQTDHVTMTLRKQLLDPRAAGFYLFGAVGRLLISSTVIWAGFAILVPALGVTWYSVLIVLIMLNHLNWLKSDAAITAANDAYAANKSTLARKDAKTGTKIDSELLVKRVSN